MSVSESTLSTSPLHETSLFISFIVRHLVDDEGAVMVYPTNTAEAGATLHVRCAADDFGKLIGKQGRTARSLRTLLAAVSVKHGVRFSLDLGEC